jgi:hypothetical protein
MRKDKKIQKLRDNHRRNFFFGAVFLMTVGLLSGCIVSKTVKVDAPANLEQDKNATFDELLKIVGAGREIKSLSSSLKLTLTIGKRETGKLKQFRRAPGLILLKRPDSLYLNVRYTAGTLLELLSIGDEFSAWYARGNKLYTGKNSAKELVPEDPAEEGFIFPGRPQHIFDAILPALINLDSPGVLVSLEEQFGIEARYYILVFSREGSAHRNHIFRKIWIERTGLTVARQQVYSEGGAIIDDIQYSNYSNSAQGSGFSLPLTIVMDRPRDGYSLKFEMKLWQIDNPDIDSGFIIKRPGATNVPLVEKREP